MRDFNADLQMLVAGSNDNIHTSPEQLELNRAYWETLTQHIVEGVTTYDDFFRLLRSDNANLEVRRAAFAVLYRLMLGIPINGKRRRVIDLRRAVPALLAAANSHDHEILQNVIHSLGLLTGSGRAFATLHRFAFSEDVAIELRGAAIRSLGYLHDSRALPVLMKLAADKNVEQWQRIDAIYAMECIGDKLAVPTLHAILRDETDSGIVRAEAAEGRTAL